MESEKPIQKPEDEFYCKLCNKKNLTIANYNSHLGSAKHQKKVKYLEANVEQTGNCDKDVKVSCFEVGKDDEDDLTNCKICSKSFSSQIHAIEHYKSKAHLHKLSIVEKMWEDKCVPCNKKFCSQLSWQNHVNSDRHKKLTQNAANPTQTCNKSQPENINEDDEDEFEKNLSKTALEKLSCDFCGKKFNGKKSAKSHLKSKDHLKLVEIRRKLLSQNAEAEKKENNDNSPKIKPGQAAKTKKSKKRNLSNTEEDEIPRKK